MLKMKSTKISTLLIAAGLMILPVLMAGCETASDSAETPFGLRTEASDNVVESNTGDVGQTAGTINNDVVDRPVEVVEETSSDVVTVGVNGNNNQARTADRSDHIFDPETAADLSEL